IRVGAWAFRCVTRFGPGAASPPAARQMALTVVMARSEKQDQRRHLHALAGPDDVEHDEYAAENDDRDDDPQHGVACRPFAMRAENAPLFGRYVVRGRRTKHG